MIVAAGTTGRLRPGGRSAARASQAATQNWPPQPHDEYSVNREVRS
jgi:hypothetical protein